jgi:hypothetical protein
VTADEGTPENRDFKAQFLITVGQCEVLAKE